MSDTSLPTLRVVSRPLTQIPDLMSLTDPSAPFVWVRHHRGFVGRGVTYRLDVTGTDRFREASRVWAHLQSEAEIDDPIDGPATGLIALGTFAFADNSAVVSTLIVPQFVIGKKDGAAWITVIAKKGDATAQAAYAHLDTHEVVDTSDLTQILGHESVGDTKPGPWDPLTFVPPEGEDDAYRKGVAEANRRLNAHVLEKVVLARRLRAPLDDQADLRVPLARLAQRYIDCWTFAVDGMIGASPETLIRSIHGKVSARVLAGTRSRSNEEHRDAELADELSHSPKEQLEHRLAVQSLLETLSPHVTRLIHDDEPYLLQLPNVWHLATNVTAKLADGADSFELADAVHPTAAVAGTPTLDAIAVIDELEPYDRGRYAGAVGWVGAGGNGDWAIALRSAQVERCDDASTITAYAGGGLVVGADPEQELAETISKFRPMIEACS